MSTNSSKFILVHLLCLVAAGLVFVGGVQAASVILSEDFEDGILDSRISIETVGTFNSSPGIKNISNFGSTKAFGYGISTCGASCFDNYVTNFKITLEEPMYVSTISFKEMELFGNWGSKGKIYVDGDPISWGTYNDNEDFGRQPTNDGNPDTTYRSKSYSINQYASIIELKVHDITISSEIFIDDVQLFGGEACVLIWKDDFESYTPGQFPSPDWSYTGNSAITVDNAKSAQGAQSLKIHGPVAGCYEAIPCRLLEVSTSEGFIITFYMYISSDHAQGCHSWTGAAGLFTECNWVTTQGVGIIDFYYDGSIGSRIGQLGSYSYDTWYKIEMKYARESSSSVKLSYWIDNEFIGSESVSAQSYEDDLLYLHFSSGDGTIWVDDITLCEAPAVEECECDLNHDGKCDMLDWLLFGEDWGRTDCPIPPE